MTLTLVERAVTACQQCGKGLPRPVPRLAPHLEPAAFCDFLCAALHADS